MIHKKITLVIASFILVGFAPAIARAQMPATRPIADRFVPAPPGAVHLTGRIGDKIDLCINHGILTQNVEKLTVPYRDKRETGERDWRCEYWGKWFTALALADAYEPSEKTAALRDQGTRELLVTAAPDGYLGTRQPSARMQGWDTWGCKYALLGVLADYDRTHDPATLAAARRQGDVLLAQFGPGAPHNIEDIGEWNGLPASSVLEPVVQLYERTGDQKYLDLANHIVACWDTPSKRLKNGMRLIDDAIAGTVPSKMCSPKAYEMMSCFEGACELYRATGQPRLLEGPVALAESVRQHELTLVGCGTSNEVWFDGTKKQTGAVQKPMETCVTATWMKFNYQLLRLTGECKYADELERNLDNALLGAMMPDGNWWAYFSGTMGVRVPSYIQHDDVGTSCCVLNGPRGLMITPSWAFMSCPDGPVVNLYSPATGKLSTPAGQPINLEITGDYPVEDRAAITLKLDHAESFSLWFRIPAWSERTIMMVNNQMVDMAEIKPGTYAKIHRQWKTGDRVAITFDMRGRVVQAPDGNGQIAICRGPIVLSLDNRLAPALDNRLAPAAEGLVTLVNSGWVDLKPNPTAAAKINAWMAFDIDVNVDGKPTTLTFCDYADAGNGFNRGNQFRTWLPQPLDLKTMYDTKQNWQTLSHANHWTDAPRQ